MRILQANVENAIENAKESLANLTYVDDNGKHHSKVCCFCDRMISHGHEMPLKIEFLRQNESIRSRLAKKKIKPVRSVGNSGSSRQM